ncbi:MAG TPA: MFS transporter [Anaerolineales bacterium]|nr:MFS transporter [Anaerolineales bacterium]
MNLANTKLLAGIQRDLAIVAISAFIWGLGEGLFIFFLPLALQRWNADAVQIGVVLSMIGVAMAVVQVPAGYLSDRFGTRPLIFSSLLLGIASAVIMSTARSLPFFVAGLLAYGCTSFISAPVNSYVTSLRGNWTIQRAVTFRAAAFQVGAILGPILGGWIAATDGLSIVFRYSAGLFLAATLVMSLAKRPVELEPLEASIHLVSPLANRRFVGLLTVVFFTIIAISVPQQLTSLYLQNVQHISIQQIGTMGTIASVGTAIIMFSLGNLRVSTGMLIGQLLLAGFALLMWQGQSVMAYFAGYFFVGGYQLYRSMALAFSRSLVKVGDTGLAYGLIETGNALAVVFAPLAAGFLYNYRPEAVYIASLGALAITVGLNRLLFQEKRNEILPAHTSQ